MPTIAELLDRLRSDGPVPALPSLADRVAEWWAALSGRRRRAVTFATLVVAVAIVVLPRPHPWGPVVDVAVVAADVPAGQPIGMADIERRAWPVALLPADPAPYDLVVGRVASRHLGIGEVVTSAAVADHSPADRAPDGWVGVPVPSELLPELSSGQVVDLHGGDGGSVAGGVVLAIHPDRVWIAVPRESARVLAASIAWGEIHVAVWPRTGATTPQT